MHKTVVRNQAYRVASFTTVQRHNERENDEYFNGDVELERAKFNVHFCQHFNASGQRETYHQTFSRLLDEGKIVKRGTKSDAKLFCELVYDINTSYFDERGGYEFAKKYFAEAYQQAVKEIGSEDYIISAVLHADEKNSRLSEQLGRSVYHYHLHVVYVPVVQKEILWSKRTKDKSLVGKVKEVIPQISQAKKWPLRQRGEHDGKTVTLNSYSFLQDRYYEHMKAAGFDGFERGERGSTTEHLEVLDYKIKQDTLHAEALAAKILAQENVAAENEKRISAQEKKIKSMKALLFTLNYNTVAEYWVMSITDDLSAEMLVTGLPLLAGQYPSANLLEQYTFLRIGSAVIVKINPDNPDDAPNGSNLGTDFLLVWGDTLGQ
jgi:hypothetical protein